MRLRRVAAAVVATFALLTMVTGFGLAAQPAVAAQPGLTRGSDNRAVCLNLILRVICF